MEVSKMSAARSAEEEFIRNFGQELIYAVRDLTENTDVTQGNVIVCVSVDDGYWRVRVVKADNGTIYVSDIDLVYNK